MLLITYWFVNLYPSFCHPQTAIVILIAIWFIIILIVYLLVELLFGLSSFRLSSSFIVILIPFLLVELLFGLSSLFNVRFIVNPLVHRYPSFCFARIATGFGTGSPIVSLWLLLIWQLATGSPTNFAISLLILLTLIATGSPWLLVIVGLAISYCLNLPLLFAY